MTPFVWDLDGTLIFTRDANLHAYMSIGILPPVDFHTKPWQDWCTKTQHERKNSVIAQYLRRYAKPTPLMQIYLQLGGAILTNASVPVVRALQEIFKELEAADMTAEVDPEGKINWLNDRKDSGVYFDDSNHTINNVNRRTSWKGVYVQF